MNKLLKKINVLKLCLLLMTVFTVVNVTSIDVYADESSYSLYDVANVIQEHFGKQTSDAWYSWVPGSVGDAGGISNPTNAGNASAFVGFGESSSLSYFISGSSVSNTAAYAAFDGVLLSSGSTTSHIYNYVKYGYALQESGLVKTASGMSMGISGMVSTIAGAMLWCFYLMAKAVPTVMSVVVTILQTFNPFSFFGYADNISAYMTTNVDDTHIMYGLAQLVSDWYNRFSGFSWSVMMPCFIAVLILTVVLLRKSSSFSTLKKFLIRITFLVIGIPLLGVTYTTMLDSVGDQTDASLSSANDIVLGTFVDTEMWLTSSRLSLPSKSTLTVYDDNGTLSITSATRLSARANAYAINSQSYGLSGTSPFVRYKETDTDLDDNDNILDNTNSSSITFDDVDVIESIISRYRSSKIFYGSEYESMVIADLLSSTNATAVEHISDMFSDSDGAGDFKGDTRFSSSTTSSGWIGSDYNIYNNGGLSPSVSNSKTAFGGTSYSVSNPGGLMSVTEDSPKGLSTIGAYNFLNTTFENSNLTVSSAKKASTGFSKNGYLSVTLAGTGLDSFLYFLEACVMLLAFTIIGIGYCFGMLFGNLKRTFGVITSMPFALLGSVNAIAKMIGFTIVAIVEVLGTILAFSIVMELLMSLSSVFGATILTSLLSGTAGATGVAGYLGGVSLASSVLSIIAILNIIIIILFCVFAMKFRKSFVTTVGEICEDICSKFLDTSPTNHNNSPGMLAKGAGAVASGAGMALGGKLGQSAMNKFGGSEMATPSVATGGDSGDTNVDASSDVDAGGDIDGTNAEGVNVDTGNTDVEGSTSEGGKVEGINVEGSNADISEGDSLTGHGNTDAETSKTLQESNGSSSVTEDEAKQAEAKQLEKAQKQEAAKDKLSGGKDAAEGAAKMYAGYQTGDVGMGAAGTQQAKGGLEKSNNAGAKARNAKSDSREQVYNSASNDLNSSKRTSGNDLGTGSSDAGANRKPTPKKTLDPR